MALQTLQGLLPTLTQQCAPRPKQKQVAGRSGTAALTTMEGRTMATGKLLLWNSAMAISVSIFVNVYVFTCPVCFRYWAACATRRVLVRKR